jgi:hypothetical protein
MEEIIINKVAESGLITIDLETFFPKEEIEIIDLKSYLFMELILKEKDFRQMVKEIDLKKFENKVVGITCSVDAIIPVWAYMLLASALATVAKDVVMAATEREVKNKIQLKNIIAIRAEEYADKRIVIKGCGEEQVLEEAYLEITKKLRPFAKSIMYGEPCSTVPVFKRM